LGEASVRGAIASECAAEQNSYWEYHDAFYEQSSAQGNTYFLRESWFILAFELADGLGLDRAKFESCFLSNRPIDAVDKDKESADKLGVKSVPTIFIDDQRFTGNRTFQALSEKIEEVLSKK
jgi:protein-disulfide isomerase